MQTLARPDYHPQNPLASSRIVELVELVTSLHSTRRQVTHEERDLLAHWMGWGPAAHAFEPRATGHWAEAGARLRMLLGPEGFEAASAATPTSFFTDSSIATTMWQIAIGLGFLGGRVLEPGCGSGAVIAAAPADLALQVTGIEREPFTASVARLRFPEATILALSLEKAVVVDGSFDLVVGNVPFSSAHIYDPNAPVRFSLHNYCIWRALMALRPGGLAILVTSRYTLDAKKDAQREELVRLGALLGAIRLPSRAHQAAHTAVVTDILILQRHTSEVTWHGYAWLGTTTEAIAGIEVNQYFLERSGSIVGTPTLNRGLYRDHDLIVLAPTDGGATLAAVVENIVQEAQRRGAIYIPPVDRTVITNALVHLREDGLKEGSYHLLDHQLLQIRDGEKRPVTRMVTELTALAQLRDATVSLLEAERDHDRPDADLLLLRRHLNDTYDQYVKTYGPIHRARIIIGKEDPDTGEKRISRRRPSAMYAFSQDPDYAIVLSLEEYDDSTQHAQKALIFFQRVNVRASRTSHADSPGEALALCLDELGRLDLAVIARLLAIDAEQVPGHLGDLIYEDPTTITWVTASEYLSGNVRIKLEEARQATNDEPERYRRNITALEAIMPDDLLPEEIHAILGAPWIGTEDIEQFCLDILGARPVVSHERLMSSWEVTAPAGSQESAASTSEWGTDRLHAYRLVEIGLNKGIAVVYDISSDDTKVKNVEESLIAQEKLRAIQARFSEWVWEDDDRAMRLAAIYNRTFNSVVPRTYDGAHLSFPGMNEHWQQNLYPWQKDFVWRMISSPSALCGHPVGAGKTTTEIAGAMTLRRMGLTSKAAVIVPNHLLEQITAEAQRLYPGAKILMVSRDDLTRDRRTLFAARIATGDYDFVVMTHSGLSAIGVHPETEKAYIDTRIAAYKEALLGADEDDKKAKRSIKKLETAIEKMRQRQEELLAMSHDDGVTFEQLGVSYIIVDEAHLYKNLGLPTNIQGLQVKAAKRATDLEMKLRWLEEQNKGRPFASFFTATPLSNSMVEAYVLAWYLNQGLLEEYNLLSVDAFASVFIELQTRVEVSPNGASFRLHTRPARFVNMPEFLALFAQFADVRGPEILSSKRPTRQEHIIVLEPSAEVQEYVDDLVLRSEEIQRGSPRSIEGKLDNMLWVTTHGRMAALDLSLVGLPQEHSPKIEAVASHMLAVYERWQKEASYLDGEFKSLQIGFCDLGTPNEQRGEQVYGKLKLQLLIGGIPLHGIRFIHEAKSDSAKALLFQQCRSGQVAILLGSTAMLGTGTNIQTRGAALHHIDAPWRPDEVEQREGRVQRPGNLYPDVEIFRYVQKRTFDAYSWQTLTNKAVFFDQMRSGKLKGREMEELGDSALSYGQVKAAATGDPLVLEQANLNVTIAHLERLRIAHLRARRRDGQEAASARARAADAASRADLFREIAARAASVDIPGFVSMHGTLIADQTEAGDIIGDRLLALLGRGGGQERIGHWSGVNLSLHVFREGTFYLANVLLEAGSGYPPIRVRAWQEWLAKGQRWRFAHAVEQVVENADDSATHEREVAQQALAHANDFEIQSREPFSQGGELARRLVRKKELDAYTALVAAAKQDEAKQEALMAIRAHLLKDASTDLSEVPVTRPLARPRRPQLKEAPVQERTHVDTQEPPLAIPLQLQPRIVEPLHTLHLTAASLFADLAPLDISAATHTSGNGHSKNGQQKRHPIQPEQEATSLYDLFAAAGAADAIVPRLPTPAGRKPRRTQRSASPSVYQETLF